MDENSQNTNSLTPDLVRSVKSRNNLHFILGILILILITGLSAFYLGRLTSNPAPTAYKDYPIPSLKPTTHNLQPSIATIPISHPLDEKAEYKNWLTFQSSDFILKYPPDYEIVKEIDTLFIPPNFTKRSENELLTYIRITNKPFVLKDNENTKEYIKSHSPQSIYNDNTITSINKINNSNDYELYEILTKYNNTHGCTYYFRVNNQLYSFDALLGGGPKPPVIQAVNYKDFKLIVESIRPINK